MQASTLGVALLVCISLSTALVPPVEASDVIYAATSNGVFKSTDEGAHWSPSNTGLSGVSVFSLAIDPRTPTTIYAGTFRSQVFKSTDAGQRWLPASAGFGDDTALAAVRRHWGEAVKIPLDDGYTQADIDTAQDLELLNVKPEKQGSRL